MLTCQTTRANQNIELLEGEIKKKYIQLKEIKKMNRVSLSQLVNLAIGISLI